MSNALINLAYKCDLKSSAKAVLVYLADQVRLKDRDRCYPSVKTIARNTGLSERTVRYKLNELEMAGLITRHFRSDTSTLYQVHLGERCTPAKTAAVQGSPNPPANRDRNPCNKRRETSTNPKKNREAIPVGVAAARIVARHEFENTVRDQVPAEVVRALRETFPKRN